MEEKKGKRKYLKSSHRKKGRIPTMKQLDQELNSQKNNGSQMIMEKYIQITKRKQFSI